jgi:hypothetical protein
LASTLSTSTLPTYATVVVSLVGVDNDVLAKHQTEQASFCLLPEWLRLLWRIDASQADLALYIFSIQRTMMVAQSATATTAEL